MRYLIVLTFMLLVNPIWGQTIVLNPTFRSPNTFSFSSLTAAGESPANITDTYQSVRYSGTSQYTSTVMVALSSGTIPEGIEIYVTAADGKFMDWIRGYGISSGMIKLSNTPTSIIKTIFSTTSVTRLITLSINITNFALIHPNTNPLTLSYTISAQ